MSDAKEAVETKSSWLDEPVYSQQLPYSETSTGGLKWQNFKDSWKRADPDSVLKGDGGNELKKGMKKRQLQMIALGGCVGSGLLVALGKALTYGPASVVIAWTVVLTFLYCTMQSLAEMSAVLPVDGSFAVYSARFIHPSWGFAMGWNYALFWVVVLPVELVAALMTINFWPLDINNDAWVAIFYVVIIGLNLCGQKGFAETEFVASVIKLFGVVGWDIFAIVMIAGGGKQGYIGAKYWHNPGSFTGGFKGVVSVLVTATYSLAGTELIGLTASESKENPRIVLPKAIKQVFWRIVIFYMLTLILIGFIVPKNLPKLMNGTSDNSASPFVIAINDAGVKGLDSVFNAVILIALLSIGNSAVYGFSRTMLGLAKEELAPKIFLYVDRKGRPLVGIAVCAIIGLISFVAASPKQGEVFAWLMALSGLLTLFTWGSICGAHIQFRRALYHQGRTTDELPYVANTGFWGAVYGLLCNIVVLCFQFWISVWPIGKQPDAQYFFEQYLAAPIVLAFFLGHYFFVYKGWNVLIPVSEIDIDTGRKEVDVDMLRQEKEEELARRKALPFYKKITAFLC